MVERPADLSEERESQGHCREWYIVKKMAMPRPLAERAESVPEQTLVHLDSATTQALYADHF